MLQDLRYALRTLARTPGFTATAGLTLALGIGATTLMFSIVHAVLWRPLPYPEPDRLVLLFNVRQQGGGPQIRASGLDFADWRARAQSFDGLAAHVGTGFTFSGTGEPELIRGQMVTDDFFRVIGVAPALGRPFTPDEFTPGREARVILTHRLWQRRFGGDAAIVNQTTTINGRGFTIVGVMPAGFEYPTAVYEWLAPLTTPRTAEMPPLNRASRYLQVVGRLKLGVSADRARVEMTTITANLAREYPESNANLPAVVVSVKDNAVRDVREPLYMLLTAVALVVLIACGNVTNLLLARATGRAREVAVRQALGAGRARLVRQFLVESVVLYAIGAGGALALAAWGLAGIALVDLPQVPRLDQATIDGRVFAATLGIAFVTAVIFGIAPALQGSVVGPAEALRSGGRTSGGTPARQRARLAIVISELALAVVLLVGAGLALRSLARLGAVDPGFDADRQLTFGIVMTPARYGDAARMTTFASQLAERLESNAGVQAAGATTHLPLSGQNMENGFTVEGFVPSGPSDVPLAGMRGVVGSYFTALGVTLKAGRFFTDADREGSQPVAIVNELFARRYWPGQNPIGKHLSEYGNDLRREVVGVIGDIRHAGPMAEIRPEVTIPYSQLSSGFLTTWSRGMTYVVRSDAPWGDIVQGARAAVASADPAMPLIEPKRISDLASNAIAQPRFRTWLLTAFALLAVVLAVVGVFGVLAYFVTQRAREIGIRVALGATSRDIVRMVLGRGMAVAAAGIVLGIAAAIPLAIWMRTLLFGIDPIDPLTLVSVAVGLAAVAALASYIPARRALRIEPSTALKSE